MYKERMSIKKSFEFMFRIPTKFLEKPLHINRNNVYVDKDLMRMYINRYVSQEETQKSNENQYNIVSIIRPCQKD